MNNSVSSYAGANIEDFNSCNDDGELVTVVLGGVAFGNDTISAVTTGDKVGQLDCYDHICTGTDQIHWIYTDTYDSDPLDCTEVKNPLYDGLEPHESDVIHQDSDQVRSIFA